MRDLKYYSDECDNKVNIKKTNQKKKRILNMFWFSKPLISIEIIIICLLIIFVSYRKVLQETKNSTTVAADNICEIYMHDTATLMEGYLQTAFSSFFREMKSSYNTLKLEKPKNIEDYISFFTYIESCNYRKYCALIDDMGNIYTKDKVNPNGNKLDFYNALKVNGDRIITVSDNNKEILGIEDESVIIIASAVEHNVIDGHVIIGIISAVDVDYLCKRMNLEATNNNSFYSGSVIKTNGDYIIHNSPFKQTERYNNYFEAYEENAKGCAVDIIKTDMLMRKSGFCTCSVFGEKSYLYYTPIKYTDLYLMIYMPYQVMENTISNLNKNNSLEFIKLTFVCILVLFSCWIIYVFQTKRDIRKVNHARKTAEEAKKEADYANRAKSNFLSHISHDIRTPLNGIIGMTDIAISGNDYSDRVKACLNDISISSDYLLTLINDVLDMNKIESGKMEIVNTDFLISDLNNECFDITEAMANSKNIRIVYKDESTCQYQYVNSDKIKIKQILMNILSNAIKYTKENGIVEFIYKQENCLAKDNESFDVKYIIKDNGIGMSKEFLKNIFDPFVQENSESRTNYSGSGLGMSIVKNLVNILGGKIDISSEIDQGTVVVVTLNLKKSKMDVLDNVEKGNNTSELFAKKRKVLIVEDNEMNLKIAIHLIANMGSFEVDFAKDGFEAIERFKVSKIDEYSFIFMDIMMPKLDGYEATKMIRSLDRKDAKNVPIIAMTANAFTESISKSQDVGMTEYITKPIDKNILKQLILKYLKEYKND